MSNPQGFKKGHDARRYVPTNTGLMDFHAKFSELLRAYSLDAVNLIVNTMNDEAAHPKLRLTAAIEILNRGLGKPVDVTVIATLDAGATQDISKLSNAELTKIIKEYQDSETIEHENVVSNSVLNSLPV